MLQIRSHTGLRGIAALLVVIYHFHYWAGPLAWPVESAVVHRFYLMVDLFFILSGFIISYANSADSSDRFDRKAYQDFLLRRWIRLYPLHAIILAAMVGFAGFRSALGHVGDLSIQTVPALLIQALLLNAWIPVRDAWNLPTWSISAELAAYAIFPLSMLPAGRARGTLVIVGIVTAYYGIVAATSGSLAIFGVGSPLRAIAGFLLGCALYRIRDVAIALPAYVLTLLQAACLGGGVIAIMWLPNDVGAIPFFAGLVWTTWTDRGAIARLAGSRILVWLGEISYSLYINHVLLIGLSTFAWYALAARLHFDPVDAAYAWIGVTLIAIIGISHMTFHLIERPARNYLTAMLLRTRPTIKLSPSAS